MGLLNRDERSALIDLLLKLPGKEKPAVRTNLLGFVPPDIKNSIDRDGAPRQDFANILNGVDDEEWDQPPVKGDWPIVTFLANAVDHAGAGARLGSQLKAVQATVTERAAAWARLPRTTPPQKPEELERQIQEIGGFLDSAGLRQCERAVCRIELEGTTPRALGTGFLLGPGVAVTNFHVLQEVIAGRVPPKAIVLRFDYAGSDDAPSAGQEYRLAEDWLIDQSPIAALDFVLLRVAGQPGTAPASDAPGGPLRGYLVPQTHDFLAGEPLVIIQHPGGRPRRFAVDRVKRVPPDGRRIAYVVDTDYGSSGSPCFTASFALVALHQGFFGADQDPSMPNRGIPFNKILEQPKVRGALGS